MKIKQFFPAPITSNNTADQALVRLLLIRMMGLGDVACIGIPAAKILRKKYPEAHITVLTYAAGGELVALEPSINEIIFVTPEEWPDEMHSALQSFTEIGAMIVNEGHYDLVYNLDTWFMPCFMGQFLKDVGIPFIGNHLSMSVRDLLAQLENKTLDRSFVNYPYIYMASTFPNMKLWHSPWWYEQPDTAYPFFFLNRCCGFEEKVEISLNIRANDELIEKAKGRKIIALEWEARRDYRNYPYGEQLKSLLENAGYYVWRQFDGSNPMSTTLSSLAASDLLVTIPTAVQWLARLAGCPTLLISGPMPPSVLGPELNIPKTQNCQFCAQDYCVAGLEFACLDIPPRQILMAVEHFFTRQTSDDNA